MDEAEARRGQQVGGRNADGMVAVQRLQQRAGTANLDRAEVPPREVPLP